MQTTGQLPGLSDGTVWGPRSGEAPYVPEGRNAGDAVGAEGRASGLGIAGLAPPYKLRNLGLRDSPPADLGSFSLHGKSTVDPGGGLNWVPHLARPTSLPTLQPQPRVWQAVCFGLRRGGFLVSRLATEHRALRWGPTYQNKKTERERNLFAERLGGRRLHTWRLTLLQTDPGGTVSSQRAPESSIFPSI